MEDNPPNNSETGAHTTDLTQKKPEEGGNPPLTFADKVNNSELQAAICCDPPRVFSEENKLEFIDAIGDLLWSLPVEQTEIPTFENTSSRGGYLLVTATNIFSKNWLMERVSSLQVWEGACLKAVPATQVPKLKKVLLWLPGKRKLQSQELLRRIEKLNPSLNTQEWRIYSRHEETHGIRLLIGIDELSLSAIKNMNFKPHWASTRAHVTPVEDLKKIKAKKQIDKKILDTKPKETTSTRDTLANLQPPFASRPTAGEWKTVGKKGRPERKRPEQTGREGKKDDKQKEKAPRNPPPVNEPASSAPVVLEKKVIPLGRNKEPNKEKTDIRQFLKQPKLVFTSTKTVSSPSPSEVLVDLSPSSEDTKEKVEKRETMQTPLTPSGMANDDSHSTSQPATCH